MEARTHNLKTRCTVLPEARARSLPLPVRAAESCCRVRRSAHRTLRLVRHASARAAPPRALALWARRGPGSSNSFPFHPSTPPPGDSLLDYGEKCSALQDLDPLGLPRSHFLGALVAPGEPCLRLPRPSLSPFTRVHPHSGWLTCGCCHCHCLWSVVPLTHSQKLLPGSWISAWLPRCAAWCPAEGSRESCVGCLLLSGSPSRVLSSGTACAAGLSCPRQRRGSVCGLKTLGLPVLSPLLPNRSAGLPRVPRLATSASHVMAGLPVFYQGGEAWSQSPHCS